MLRNDEGGADLKLDAQARALSVVVAGALATSAALAAKSRVFVDAAACVASGSLAAPECRRAQGNARAEFEEKAPRFPTRALCERLFARCMIADIFGHGGVDFTPVMRGFEVSEGRRPMTTPILEGGASTGLFEGRPIDRDETRIDRAKYSAPRGEARTRAPKPEADDRIQSNDFTPGAYPVPEAQWREMRERERRFGADVRN
jgi:hypothetical protein